VPISRSAKQKTEEALAIDASVFDYDGVYESMKVGERESKAQREEEKRRRDPKYIAASMASSEQRKIDRIRAESKMIQRERDLEGEEYAGTESFVTDAYKEQMEEMKEAESKEKEKEEKDRLKSKGVASFYRKYMEEDDRAHQAAVAASLKAKPFTSDGARGELHEGNESKESERRRAVQEAREKGFDVRVNDDNEVVDERSLLSAGLNTFGKKAKKEEDAGKSKDRDSRVHLGDRGMGQRDGAREAREAREAQRQRQSRMIEDQMLELEKKREAEAKQEEEERKKLLVKDRRNDQDRIANAKMRALERKRKRETEDKGQEETVPTA
jgi:coiled-coil domain-containing protein 55